MKYDLAIVGAGVLGTFSAFHALNKGLKVILIEKDYTASGATVQNFGQIVPSGFGTKWCNIGRRSLEIYKDIQSKVDITFKQNGSLYIASDEEECQLLHELHHLKKAESYPSYLLTQGQIASKVPSIKKTYAKEGLFFKNDASVDPTQMIHLLQAYMVDHLGLRFEKNASVIACEDKNTKVEIRTSHGLKIESQKAWIFSGAVFNLLFPSIFQNSGIIVSQLQMLKTIALQNIDIKPNLLTGLTVRRYESFECCPSFSNLSHPIKYAELQKYGIHILFKQELDGRIIIGDSHEYAPPRDIGSLGLGSKENIDNLIINEAMKIIDFPLNAIESRWTGRYSQHKEDIFEFDISGRIHICTGIGGKGMTSGAGYTESKIKNASF